MQVWHSTMTLRFTGADAVDELAEYTKEASMTNLAKKGGECGVSVKFQAGGRALSPQLEGGNYGQFFPGQFGSIAVRRYLDPTGWLWPRPRPQDDNRQSH